MCWVHVYVMICRYYGLEVILITVGLYYSVVKWLLVNQSVLVVSGDTGKLVRKVSSARVISRYMARYPCDFFA